ncbi:MAG: serine hydrolase [Oscillospiraceae bacterium]|nr:serine hydrolase [Oscillospiraceae bacterium]
MRKLLSMVMTVIFAVSFMGMPVSAADTVTLSRTSIELPAEHFMTLSVTGAAGKVKWRSENSEIASAEPVDNASADVIGNKTGETYIYAEADGRTLKCRVSVKPSLISVSSDSAELGSDDSKKVWISVLGSKSITVKNSNKNVCSVSWGKWVGDSISININTVKSGSSVLNFYTKGNFDTTAVPVKVSADSDDILLVEDDKAPKIPGEWKDIKPVSERVTVAETGTYEELCAEMNKLVKDYPYECAVLLYSMEKGDLYKYNAGNYYSGGCTVKLPYVYYCCLQIEAGNHSLDEMITYTSAHKVGGSGVIQNKGYGTKWSIATLLDYSMRYSDNVAYYMLISVFGKEGFNKMMEDWGYSTRLGYSNYPGVSSEMLKTAMIKVHDKVVTSDNRCWQNVWNGLVGSVFYEVRKEITYCDVAIKCGLPLSFYNEVCYIDSDSPYILVIMSRTTNESAYYDGDEKFFRAVANCADRINKLCT